MPRSRSCGGTNRCRAGSLTTRPLIAIVPPLGVSSPAMQRKVVVLPQPLGPSSVTNSPAATSNEIAWITVAAP